MSLHYWNSVYERRELECVAATTCILYVMEAGTSDDDSSESDEDEDHEGKSVLPVLFTLATIEKHVQVFASIEDGTIQFGRRMTVDDYNECQCIKHFRFRKDHLKEVARALWFRLEMDGCYKKVKCHNYYTCPFETALLLLLYRFSTPTRLRPNMESFFGMRKSHISATLKTIVDAMYELAMKYLHNPNIFRHRIKMYAKK